MEAGIATAPSIRLPLGFILCGLVCLPGVIALLIARPTILSTYHYNQHVIAATHLALLGWIGSVVFGVLYQLVPVALETRLASQRLAFVHLLCHAVAVPGMVWSFWHWNLKQVGHWGSIFALGVTLLLLNVGWTAIRSRRWNPVSAGMGSALGWLLAAAMAGLALAASKCSYESLERLSAGNPLAMTLRGLEAVSTFVARFDQMSAMHTHAHLGVLGGFVLLTVTLSLKLLPMFLLSEVQSPRRAWWVIGLLNAGLLGLAVTMATRSPWKLVFAGLLTTALLLHALELRALLRARKRRLLDGPLRMFLSGLTVTVPLAGLAGVLSWPGLPLTVVTGQLENLYGFLAVFGLISTAILGMLFKILSFLVWYGTYSPHLGRTRVPNLADMYSEHRLRAGAMVYALALTLVCAGILLSSTGTVRWGGIAMAAAVALHLSNYGLILGHRLRPRWQPVAARPGQSAGIP
ncbi:MAG: hypothetical protein MUE94_04615 [Verrucomicrobia bacterium]|nr:hypothetical protein [Verrucomicrobiota bacterium]